MCIFFFDNPIFTKGHIKLNFIRCPKCQRFFNGCPVNEFSRPAVVFVFSTPLYLHGTWQSKKTSRPLVFSQRCWVPWSHAA